MKLNAYSSGESTPRGHCGAQKLITTDRRSLPKTSSDAKRLIADKLLAQVRPAGNVAVWEVAIVR
jgi:hypothetical protein